MGARGPVPKREAQRRRTNKPKQPTKKAAGAATVSIPRADPKWHPAAKRFYAALQKSGQHKFYEPSDWQLAWLTAESLSRDLKPQVIGISDQTGKPVFAVVPLKGASLAAYLKAFNALLVTEGDRRRLGIELERPGSSDQSDAGDVPSLDDYRKRLAG
jgi:hypothetical protein